MKKIIPIIAISAVCMLLGIFWGSRLFTPKLNVEQNSNIVVEKIEKVAKLITVESHLSEIYNHKDYYNYDLSFLRKKALLRINAKVSTGYDLKKLNIKVDPMSKSVTLGPIPKAEILSIDHTLDYFDIEEGLFNSFTPEDYNKINANAKEYVKQIANNSDVMKNTADQEKNMLEMMNAMAKSMGYSLIVLGQNNEKR